MWIDEKRIWAAICGIPVVCIICLLMGMWAGYNDSLAHAYMVQKTKCSIGRVK